MKRTEPCSGVGGQMENGKPRKNHYWRHDGICLYCGKARDEVATDAADAEPDTADEELPGWHWKRAVNVVRRMIGFATWWRNIGWLNSEEGEE